MKNFNISYIKVFNLGLTFRLIVFIYLINFPFIHSLYGEISPIAFQSFADLNFYSAFGMEQELKANLNEFFFTYKFIFDFNLKDIDNRYPGPFFPMIIWLTNYSEQKAYLLGILAFVTEIICFYFWSNYFYKKIDKLCAILFCFLPMPLYFGFFHSTDIFFFLILTLIFFILIEFIKIKNNLLLIFLILLAAITRPSCFFIFIYLIYYFLVFKRNYKLLFVTIFILMLSIIYYLPYFIIESYSDASWINTNSFTDYNFIFFTTNLYLDYILFYIFKFISVFGFIKSDSGNIYFYVMRCLCASIFLIGYLYSFYKKDLNNIIFINLLIIPIIVFLYPAYRYIIPVAPLLFMYFYLFLKDLLENTLNRS